jgi:integrating conjugative element relaxase (TIGR03760 family)
MAKRLSLRRADSKMFMLSLFRPKRPAPPAEVPEPTLPKGLLRPESAAELLATTRRQRLLEHIWQRTSLSRAQFATLYRKPLERYAELVQLFPASESHHHTYAGGMLDHGLEIVAYALKLRQSHLLPIGAPPETQAAQAEAWTAGAAYAALLHDIGKIAVDLHVELADDERWHPWHGPLKHPYRFRYRKDRVYRLHGAAAGLLYTDILDRSILDWLSGFPELWAALLYVLAGQYEHAGILGELVQHADQASVAQDLGGNPAEVRQAPKQALQRKLLDGLRYLLKEELKLNQPQASDGWLTQDALWLVSKTVCDKLRAHLLSQGIEGIPDRNTAVFDVLQEHGIAQPTPDGKAIWRATIISDTGWTHSFTLLKLAPALIWDAQDRPAPFAGAVQVEEMAMTDAAGTTGNASTSSPLSSPAAAPTQRGPLSPTGQSGDSVHDVLALFADVRSEESAEPPDIAPEPPSASSSNQSQRQHRQPTVNAPPPVSSSGEPIGAQLMSWLRHGIHTRRLKINDARALVHTVAGTAFLVSPGLFQRFAQEHPDIARDAKTEKLTDWEWAQKSFERQRLHKKQPNGLNIWTCEVTGPRRQRRLHGYLLSDGHTLFPDLPFDNPHLRLLTPGSMDNTNAA